jgi:hypothetical protein
LGFLDTYEGTERIQLDDTYYVDVKKCLTQGEYKRVEAFYGAGKQTVTMNGKQFATIDPAAAQEELLVLSITDWNLTDAAGIVLPLAPDKDRRASIARLPKWAFIEVYQRCDELNGPRKDAAQFPVPDLGGAEDGDGGAAGADPVPD